MSQGVRHGALLIALAGCGASGPTVPESLRAANEPQTASPRRPVTRLPLVFHRPSSEGAQRSVDATISDDTVWSSPYPAVAPQNSHRRVVLRGREEVLGVDRNGEIINSRLIVTHCSAYENGQERPIAAPGSQIIISRSPRGGRIELVGSSLSRVDQFWLSQVLDTSLSASHLHEPNSRRAVGDRWALDGGSVSHWLESGGLFERLPAEFSGARHLARVRQLDTGAAMDVETVVDASGVLFRGTPANLSITESSAHALFSEVLPVDPNELALAWVMELRMEGRGTIRFQDGQDAPVQFSSRRVLSRTYRRLDQWLR